MPESIKREYCTCCEQGHWPLVLCGDVGVGKSVFAALAFRDWQRGSAHFLSAASAASLLKTAEINGVLLPGASDTVRDGALLRRWGLNTGLLVLDDLTNGLTFANAAKSIWRIINERAHRPAIYTANGSPDDLADALGTSLSDRLFHGTCLLWPGDSRRRQQARIVVVEPD